MMTGGIFMLTSSKGAGVASAYGFGLLGGTLVGTKCETNSALEKNIQEKLTLFINKDKNQ
jgi:hypothetical protein